jgi:F0F1-type ATP synthase membrane subunit b/b'
MERLNKASISKVPLVARVLKEKIEAIRDGITEDNATVVAAMTAASAEATLEDAQTALATAISDANTQASARVDAINVTLRELHAALSL